jgi:hypothetical protein
MADDNIQPDVPAAPAGEPKPEPVKKEPPVIHVIPEEFHAASGKRVNLSSPKDRKKEEVQKPAAAEKGGQAVMAADEDRPRSGGGGKLRVILIIVLAVLILGGGGFGAYYFLVMAPASQPAPPAPVEPTGPVCGDGSCNGSETYDICAADCPPPAAVCGDGACEPASGETKLTCSADCGEPEAVCGDDRCEEAKGETYDSCPADCEPPAPTPAADTDSDGLSDVEETGLYGTNAYVPDTDRDTYVDLNELLNLFNPALPQPSLLADNPGILEYQNASGFRLYRPALWVVSEDAVDQSVTFGAATGEYVKLSYEANPTGQSLVDWYLAQNPSLTSSQVEVVPTKQGYDSIVSDDQLNYYIAFEDYFITLDYSLADQILIRFKATVKMMVNSLRSYTPSGA